MFKSKPKMDTNLKIALIKGLYKCYRVIIQSKLPCEKIASKVVASGGMLHHSIDCLNCVCATITPRTIHRLLELPEVTFITTDTYALLCANRSTLKNGTSGHSICSANGVIGNSINLNKSSHSGGGVSIGLIDSGVFPHPDLTSPKSKLVYFTDLVNNLHYPYDDNGHGTFTSGLICGDGKASKGLYRGISPGAELCVVKAFDKYGRSMVSTILKAIETLLYINSQYNIKVICLPFEILENNFFILSLFNELFSVAISKNIVIIAAAGSDGSAEGSLKGIGTLNTCLTIGGIDTSGSSGEILQFGLSSMGPLNVLEKPDLVAAAANICSLNCDTSYISERNGRRLYAPHISEYYINYSGTSCAVAYISGLCSLLFESDNSLSPEDITALLKLACIELELPKAVQGAGLINYNKLMS